MFQGPECCLLAEVPCHLERVSALLLSDEVVYIGQLDPVGNAIELTCWVCPFVTEDAGASNRNSGFISSLSQCYPRWPPIV